MAVGTPVVKTSYNFIYGMISENPNIIYLQRGYRIYGNPVAETLEAMTVIEKVNLDYVLNEN